MFHRPSKVEGEDNLLKGDFRTGKLVEKHDINNV